jgi:DNA (cytosine-5)-methyltransferase 1
MMHKFPYDWSLKDYPEKHGLKVMSTFACGGGSTMGYKLAGYDVIAANDIDDEMEKVYKANHKPKHFIKAPIKDLLTMELPKELYGIDILDGSPPCSVFSTTGLREEAWGKDKMFREGQAKQVLDDLFFDFIALVEKLRPKVVVAENVKGMLIGNAKWYTREVDRKLQELGYTGQIFLLNGATMGVPQKRERVFFVYAKNELKLPKLKLAPREPVITYGQIRQDKGIQIASTSTLDKQYYQDSRPGLAVGKFQSTKRMDSRKAAYTIRAGDLHFDSLVARRLYKEEVAKIGSFPNDFNYLTVKPQYLIGMSVPPLMIAHVASAIYEQWGDTLKEAKHIGEEESWLEATPVVNSLQAVS